MTDPTQGLPVLRRAVTEHRTFVVALAVAFVVNVVVYALVVDPLAERVANIEQRDQDAEELLAQAMMDHAQASGTLTGKTRASAQLATFYEDVLPRDLAGARRLTYLRLARLARESNLQYERSSYDPTADTDSSLTRLRIQMVLSGTYANLRDFIYQLETAPEFVVIDSVQLTAGRTGTTSLVATLRLSTYFREGRSKEGDAYASSHGYWSVLHPDLALHHRDRFRRFADCRRALSCPSITIEALQHASFDHAAGRTQASIQLTFTSGVSLNYRFTTRG